MTREQIIEAMARASAERAGQEWEHLHIQIHSELFEDARAGISAIEALGYVVVPREATVEMEVAGTEAWLCEAAMEDRSAVNYRAMIEAGKV